MPLVGIEGMSWRAVSASSVSAFSPPGSSSSPSQSSFVHLSDMQYATSAEEKDFHSNTHT